MRVSRERVLAAAPAEVWEVVGDPWALSRWWPRVERVESVDAAGFTEVYRTKRAKTVRADFRIATLDGEREIRVVQQLEGTPFARIFVAASRRARLEPVDGGTRVTLDLEQTPAGMARFGAWTMRSALRTQLDGGLDTLATLLERPRRDARPATGA